MVSQISNEINPLGAPLEMECVENNPVRAGAQLFSDGGQFLHAAKGSNPRCRYHLDVFLRMPVVMVNRKSVRLS